MKWLSTAIIFTLLSLTLESSLKCNLCTPDVECNPNEDCSTSTQCIVGKVEETGTGVEDKTSVYGGCSNGTSCNTTYLLHYRTKRVTGVFTCCNTDDCNDSPPDAPDNEKENDLVCCANQKCKDTVKCIGEEQKCIINKLTSPAADLRGCASPTICATPTPRVDGFKLGNVTCCDSRLCNEANIIYLNIIIFLLPLFVLKTFA